MERVLQSTAPTISARFYVDGVGTDPSPDTATVTVTRADGTVLVASTGATNVAGVGNAGLFSFQLTTTHTALLDRLTVRWTSNLGTVTTTVEVAGGFLFSTAEMLADDDLQDSLPTAADVAEARTIAEQDFEQVCGVAFVPRYERERIATTRPYWWNRLELQWRQVRTVRDATVDGVALSGGQLATIVPTGKLLYYPSGWTRTTSGVVFVGYEHGYDRPTGGVSRAVRRLAKHYLTDWSADDRALRLDTDTGSYVMAVPGRAGSEFGIPEVDQAAERYGGKVPFA